MSTARNHSVPEFDVVVVGGGHSGCEAALAAARIGARTMLVTQNLDKVAGMPCNPSIGGPAKGHLVREIDALGGEMARNSDRTQLQMRTLNTGKGPAVRAMRAQCDKALYSQSMGSALRRCRDLVLCQAQVDRLIWEPNGGDSWRIGGVVTGDGEAVQSRCVVITTGTFLNGRIVMGEQVFQAGRAGEPAAFGISEDLGEHGFELGRLKTGTPPRIDAESIDYRLTEIQPGSPDPLYFSFLGPDRDHRLGEPAAAWYPGIENHRWSPQMPCYSVHTNPRSHEIISGNLHRAPMYDGTIASTGPRYCPSIEDKIVRFAQKSSHQLFLEPEGFADRSVYVQGANTSLPADVQQAMLESVPALASARVLRYGYAIEYDYAPPHQIDATLEARSAAGLFLAGQINGTTGYEEAAAQGLLAGINAALTATGREPLTIGRHQGYVGVMVDDLVTKDLDEPYRVHTSRAEYRLLLRQDNADRRLTPIAARLGLADGERLDRLERKEAQIARAEDWLRSARLGPERVNPYLLGLGQTAVRETVPAHRLLARPGVTLNELRTLAGEPGFAAEVAEQVELASLYAGYISQQQRQVERARSQEDAVLPDWLDYSGIQGLRTEARIKLARHRPATLGQASRLSGVTASDLAVLMVQLRRAQAA
ncbi:MAG: tRNA uridine-5-carboxymethylaminomethyl(34) synthesis enzyme MnmG [Chloroflexi bacterium]|nr:tRNA uridine-5-carboxymethylaminomethyl(34) synthesis enzyme MnmG [Chloroflexota bacterium]MXY13972.1 tRNA uridine-5-carboxymethylaminomethyl(34) synthesis enzyme MnmG [Chloroflexota bacterium]MYB16998.1 tRNA uridine-5-carboxymethylaminomethyl(34) synthesis enzyme MnmG [Chloroflexota bacterium]